MQSVPRRRFLLIAGGGLVAAGGLGIRAWPGTNDAAACAVTRSTPALGTVVRITALQASPQLAEAAIDGAFAELSLVERLMSIYRPDSQVSRLNADGLLLRPHPYLVEVLRHAQRVSALSHGRFDVTVQPLWEAFARAAKAKQIPSAAEVVVARSKVDWRHLEVTEDVIRFSRPGMKITLNGIAQGFAADRVLAALRSGGVEQALVDAGELRPLGRAPRGAAWRAGIQHPRDSAAYLALADLDGRALATSGDYATRFSPDGRHHHIFDPRTGNSPTELCSVSIVAPTAMAADALSTACLVLGPERSLALIAKLPAVDVYFVLKDGEALSTAGFPLSAT